MWKKSTTIALSVILILSLLVGCAPESKIEEEKVNIYTSFFPLYDLTKQIGGSRVNVINLIPAGVDAHDWTPKSRELSDIKKAQMFVYNGAGFEGWVEEFLNGVDKANGPLVVEATKGLDLIELTEEKAEKEAADGHDHGHDHGHENEKEHDEHDHGNIDPHTWMSPLQAKKMSENIYQAIIQVDAKNKAEYEQNYQVLQGELEQLHQKYVAEIAKSKRKELVVQHEAYGYLCRDYGLTQMPILGVNPDAEPTAQDMKKISDFVKKHKVKYIMFEEMVSSQVATTLADDLGIGTLVFNPIEGLTEEQEAAGETYVSMMQKNLESLVKALQ